MLGIFISLSKEQIDLQLILQSQMSLEEGSSYDINYEINIKEAEISFAVADSRVAKIENNKIFAVGAGNTILRATASYKDKIIHSSCKIVVSQQKQSFYYYIQTNQNCNFNNDTLFVSDYATFYINLYDSKNLQVDSSKLDYSCSSGIQLEKQFDIFLINASKDGVIYFKLEELEFDFLISVKCINKKV